VFSIEDRIWDDERTSVSDAVVRMLGQSREAFRRVCRRGREFWDDLKAPALQRHFWRRNEFYALPGPRNPLISQQMRPPSERTMPGSFIARFGTDHCKQSNRTAFVSLARRPQLQSADWPKL
jgi:hypothetical protein